MKILGNIIKSKSDNRIYRAIRLENNLQCLLISDHEAQKSSAALSVSVGSILDPVEAQGLAHYLEHMLFMGTKKYPNQNQYSDYLAKNSGRSNAYTSLQQTNYHFEVSSPAFIESLDRFAQFFIDPLMAQSSSERELNAVHSEHTKNILNDSRRKYHLWKYSAKVGHSFNKFSTGNKNTLNNPNIRNYLLNFYKQNYSSNLMKLVIYSKQSIEVLSEVVNQKFGSISNKNIEKYKMESIPFDQSNLGNVYKIVPIKDIQSIQYVWIISNQQDYYKNPPGKYISHLIGHQGPNSLLSLLIKQGLALELSASSTDKYNTFTQLSITITLTNKGFQNINLITQYLLYYIQMLKQKGPQIWVYEQIKKINKLKFDNLDKRQGISFCSQLASKIQNFKMQQAFIANYFMEEWKPQLITNYLNQITQKNLRIMFVSKKFQNICTQTQPIYGTKYNVEPLQNVNPRKTQVDLPPINQFIPQNIDLLPISGKEFPEKIYHSQFIHLFYKQDHRFYLPKAHIKFRLYFLTQINARNQVIKDLYKSLLKNSLRQLQYMAQTASISISFNINLHMIDFDIYGFTDSLRKFLPIYLDKFLNFKPDNFMQFENFISKKRRQYSNFFNEIPYLQANRYKKCALLEGSIIDPQEKLIQIEKIKFEQIINFGKNWKNSLFCQLYVGGNILSDQSIVIGKLIQQKLLNVSFPISKQFINQIRSVKLVQHQTWAFQKYIKNPQQINSVYSLHYQYQKSGINTKVLQDLCLKFVKQPAFDYLRTKQQLGYIVSSSADDNRGILGISFLIQSNIKASHELKKYINNLMDILLEKLKDLTEDQFQIYKKSYYSSKLQKDKSLDIETDRFWDQIVKHTYKFNRKQQELQKILSITLAEFKQFFLEVFVKNPRCYQTHMMSQKNKAQNQIAKIQRLASQKLYIAPSIQYFKKRMTLNPDYYIILEN